MQRTGNLLNRIARPILNHHYDPIRLTASRKLSTLIRHDPIRLTLPRKLAEREDMPNFYFGDVCYIGKKITAAFRSSVENEAYLFMNKEYVLLNYAPGTRDDKVLSGPNLVRNGFETIEYTEFYNCGISCAFGTHYGNEAFIFSGNCCAHINYEPGTPNFKMLTDTTIDRMFPFLRRTAFENGVSAAFESSTTDEAYLIRGNKYARINYRDGCLISFDHTFTCLKNTKFEDGIDAAFASHRANEAYIFKEDSYARINFADDYIIGGVKKILPDEWPSLNDILPRKVRHVVFRDAKDRSSGVF